MLSHEKIEYDFNIKMIAIKKECVATLLEQAYELEKRNEKIKRDADGRKDIEWNK